MQEGKDLTEGNIFNNMVKYSIPLLIANLLSSMYNIVDGIWIAKLIGDNGLAITTNAWPITLLANSILSGVLILASVFVAQSYVNSNKNKIKEVVTPIYIISIIIGILTSIILIFTENFWLTLFKTPKEIFDGTKMYLNIYLIGHIFNFFAMTIIESIRAIGNSKVPLYILSFIEIVNILLDPILILLGLGIEGAAIATAFSMILGLFLSIFYIKKNNADLCFDKKYAILKKDFLKKAALLGIPMAIQEISTIFTIMLEINVSNSLGVIGSTAYGAVSKIQSLIWVMGSTIRTLLTVIVGQAIGKSKIEELSNIMKNSLKLIIFPTILIALFLILFSKQFCYIFTQNENVIIEAMKFLKSAGLCFTLILLCQTLSGFVLGTGNTKFSFIVSLIADVFEFIIIITINKIFNEPMIAIGIGISGWYIVITLIFGIFYLSKKWKETLISV